MDQYVVTILHSVLTRDTSDTEPMNYPPKSIGKIPNVWICYLKGIFKIFPFALIKVVVLFIVLI